MAFRFTAVVLVLVLLNACHNDQHPTATTPVVAEQTAAAPGPFTAQAQAAEQLITGEAIRATVQEIGGDAYEGRGPGTPGDSKARNWLAAQLADLGYEPGANGGWEQVFDLISITASQPKQWAFAAASESLNLQQGSEFIVGSGVQNPVAKLAGSELVFVGYGIQAPEYGWDDFKGRDLTGKTLVMLNNDPDWDADLFAGDRRLYYGRWSYKYESAARQGAAGAIIIHTTPSAGYPWQVIQTSWTGAQFELPAGDEPRLQIAAWVTEDAAAKLMRMAEADLESLVASARSVDFAPVDLGLTTTIALDTQIESVQSANVLGLLEGSDPALKDEVVVFTAHHDHLGIGLPNFAGNASDRIYNGARDNASGAGMVLAIAGAISSLPQRPRRSILIAFVGAEEQGLLGSKYFARFPTFEAGKIAANVNFDSGNIWGLTHDITFIGKGKSTLDAVADQVAEYSGRVVLGDPFPDKGSFYRSDQFSLAKIGVPALYLNGGTNFVGQPEGWGVKKIGEYITKNYHQPSDELTQDWNFDGMQADARFGFWCGLIVANADTLPAWLPGDEFEAARMAAVKAAQ